jgi:hypothetical protein
MASDRAAFFQGIEDDAATLLLSHASHVPLELPSFDLLRLNFGLCGSAILLIPALLPSLTRLVSAQRTFEQSVNYSRANGTALSRALSCRFNCARCPW